MRVTRGDDVFASIDRECVIERRIRRRFEQLVEHCIRGERGRDPEHVLERGRPGLLEPMNRRNPDPGSRSQLRLAQLAEQPELPRPFADRAEGLVKGPPVINHG